MIDIAVVVVIAGRCHIGDSSSPWEGRGGVENGAWNVPLVSLRTKRGFGRGM